MELRLLRDLFRTGLSGEEADVTDEFDEPEQAWWRHPCCGGNAHTWLGPRPAVGQLCECGQEERIPDSERYSALIARGQIVPTMDWLRSVCT